MKTKILYTVLFALLSVGGSFAQDVTTVRANSADISDNLDLKAVASIFGDSRDLEDFERRLNDPDVQISNLDLNGDNRVDYLRVIESTEGNTHLIILQSVLGVDTFQDVATIEVERDRNNNVQVQVVGDVYMYGPNYIYEPVYVRRPFLFDVFWVSSYRPYYSPWYWGYYPTYYSYWAPYPVYRYRNNIHVHINNRNTYTYCNTRRSSRAMAMYSSRRTNAYERQHPNTGFSSRNNVSNRYALEQSRSNSRAQSASGGTRSSFNNSSARPTSNVVRNTNINSVRNNGGTIRNTTPSRSGQDASNSNGQIVRSSGTPSRVNSNTPARTVTTPPSRNTAQPSMPSRSNSSMDRGNSMPSVRNSTPARSSAPTMNTPIPSRSSSPTIRNSAPAPARQSAPAPSRSSGGGGGGHAGGRRG
ncbi:hypothetical protein HYN59_11630 [Flavobacterium album]|uniref:DUF3300 domain-containing protein n=1 Tax=Flavobacterium album TaxID=2175091 RepID=A0A2S1QZ67_9FLAO|nr:hypothetical protein [Flavobacterium album]AWH85717.1 hypothetical protein HYN59_11630 [Flavobacterium album]